MGDRVRESAGTLACIQSRTANNRVCCPMYVVERQLLLLVEGKGEGQRGQIEAS